MTICVKNLTIVLYLAEAADVHNDERGEDKNAGRRDWYAPVARDMNGCAVVICAGGA